MRLTLNNTLEESVKIKDELEMLKLYLDLEQLRTRNKFQYSFKTRNNFV